MYDGKSVGVRSTLCYKCQWDAMLDFIKAKGFDINNLEDWGNFKGAKFKITRKSVKKFLVRIDGKYANKYSPWIDAINSFVSTSSESYLLTTGASDRNSTLNIYDVAGNCSELTMCKHPETSNVEARLTVGCSVSDSNNLFELFAEGSANNEQGCYADVGFRPSLFIDE